MRKGEEFITQAREITRRHLEMVEAESASLFVSMLSTIWMDEAILSEAEARHIPRELHAHLKRHYALDQIQALCSFFLDFFSDGLAGQSDGAVSFTNLEFEGLKLFEQKFAHRLPAEDKLRLHELIRLLEKAGSGGEKHN